MVFKYIYGLNRSKDYTKKGPNQKREKQKINYSKQNNIQYV